MLAAKVCGWTPAGNDGDDVNIARNMHLMSIEPSFPPSWSAFLGPICPPLNLVPPPDYPRYPVPTPLQRSHPIVPSSDRRAQSKRNRDPSWIPRPRNAFIIFRCEYSREHSQGSQDSHDHDDSTDHKTLSKRAADAWKELSPSEKDWYKQLADREREEHARLYPHYRFRPMKRHSSGTSRAPRGRSRASQVGTVDVSPAPSAHLLSEPVLTSAPTKSCPSVSMERSACAALPQGTASSLPELVSYPCTNNVNVPFSSELDESLLFYPSPEGAMLSETSPPAYTKFSSDSSFCPSIGGMAKSFCCNDSMFGLDPVQEDPERAQALEAYAMGLYNFDLLSSFGFPELC